MTALAKHFTMVAIVAGLFCATMLTGCGVPGGFVPPTLVEPLPEGYPEELWLDMDGLSRFGMKLRGERRLMCDSHSATATEIVSAYDVHLAALGWSKSEAAPESCRENTTCRTYKKDDATFTIEAENYGASWLSVAFVYTTPALVAAHEQDMAARIAAFGPEEPEARALMDRVLETYRTCETYQDAVRYVSHESDSGEEGALFASAKFTTAFDRDAGLRFEHRDLDDHDRYVIWGNETEAKAFWTVENEEEKGELNDMLSAAYGVTSEASGIVIDLLRYAAESSQDCCYCSPLTGLAGMKTLSSEMIDGKSHASITGISRSASVFTLWIDEETSQISRIKQINEVDGDIYIEVFNFDATINAPLPAGALEFKPAGTL